MTNSDDDSEPSAELPAELVAQLDSLELVQLKSVKSYVEERIRSVRPPIEEEIEANAAGEILTIDAHGTDALVRKVQSTSEESGSDSEIVSLYHVTAEPRIDGTSSLHWSYLGDVQAADEFHCTSCGHRIDEATEVCPHCGSEDPIKSKFGDDT